MAAIKLEKNNIICHGCLSVDRSLLPIKKNMDLYFILLGNQQFYSGVSFILSLNGYNNVFLY